MIVMLHRYKKMPDGGVKHGCSKRQTYLRVVTLADPVLHLCGSGLASTLCNHLVLYRYILLHVASLWPV